MNVLLVQNDRLMKLSTRLMIMDLMMNENILKIFDFSWKNHELHQIILVYFWPRPIVALFFDFKKFIFLTVYFGRGLSFSYIPFICFGDSMRRHNNNKSKYKKVSIVRTDTKFEILCLIIKQNLCFILCIDSKNKSTLKAINV